MVQTDRTEEIVIKISDSYHTSLFIIIKLALIKSSSNFSSFCFFPFQAPEGDSQPSTEVDLFISTEKIMVLNTDLKVRIQLF